MHACLTCSVDLVDRAHGLQYGPDGVDPVATTDRDLACTVEAVRQAVDAHFGGEILPDDALSLLADIVTVLDHRATH